MSLIDWRTKKMSEHPWAVFLDARYKVILWMRDEKGYSDYKIAESLSMTENQVYAIRKAMEHKFEEKDE